MKAGLQRRSWCIGLGLAACFALALPVAARAQNHERGELLYDTYCTSCHGSVMHVRERRARTMEEIARQVARWQSSLGLKWTDQEIADVARYLDRRFYKLPHAVSDASGADHQSHR